MAKRLSLNINYSEDYQLLAIVSHLKDYRLSFFLNQELDLDLRKYDDLKPNETGASYSWYYYSEGETYLNCYLISNHHNLGKLVPALKNVDYLLFVKNPYDDKEVMALASSIRKIPNVMAVFEHAIPSLKDVDSLIEAIELHELEQIIRPAKLAKNKLHDFAFVSHEPEGD